MGSSWEDLLDVLTDFRDLRFPSDPEREAARIDNIEFILQRMLEKLRDKSV